MRTSALFHPVMASYIDFKIESDFFFCSIPSSPSGGLEITVSVEGGFGKLNLQASPFLWQVRVWWWTCSFDTKSCNNLSSFSLGMWQLTYLSMNSTIFSSESWSSFGASNTWAAPWKCIGPLLCASFLIS